MAFELSKNVEVHQDESGTVRLLRHPYEAYSAEQARLSAPSPADLAVFDTVVASYQQTVFGLPIWQAAIEVRMFGEPLRVVN